MAKNKLPSRNAKKNDKGMSKYSIYSIGGCLTLTIIAVAIFFIAYIVMGINLEG